MFKPTRYYTKAKKPVKRKMRKVMNELQKSFHEKWVKALRSDKYKQGSGVLKSLDGGFCCLGVLCDIAQPMLKMRGYKKVGWKVTDAEHYVFTVGGERVADLSLPEVLVDLFGIEQTGKVKRVLPKKARKMVDDHRGEEMPAYATMYMSLANLNDKDVPFSVIADIIEKFPNTFFKDLPE